MLVAAAPLLAGCAGFWDAPSGSSNSSFSLTNSGNISVTPGATTGNTSTITVTPASSFSGTVSLACSVTSAPTAAVSATTCSLSPTSIAFSTTTAQTSTLYAATTATTTAGAYQITVTGTSGSLTATTNLCAQVSSSSGSCTATAGSNSGIFYVLDQGTMQIAGFSVVSGVVTQSGNAFTFPSAPYSIAVAPGGGFLYVGTATGIYLFDISSSGTLTLPSSSTISQDVAASMQVVSTSSGSWLVEAGPNLAALLAIPINATTGSPTTTIEQSILLPGATVQQLAVSPDNKNVFVALGSFGTEVVTFSAGSATPFGTISNIPRVNLAGAALSVAVDPSNRLLYIGETAAFSGTNAGGTGGLRVFNYSTLAEVTGSPFATGGLAPYAIYPTRYGTNAGNYVYVVNRTVSNVSTGNIASFSVTTSGATSTLSQLNLTATAGITPVGLTEDSTGNYLLVVNSGGSPDLLGFTFDATTAGKLDSAISSATGTDPVQAGAVAALP
jgi:6-phosphogluconolactonase (cycloisomerase 2 family)